MKNILLKSSVIIALLVSFSKISSQELQWIENLPNVEINDIYNDWSGTYITGSFTGTVDFDLGSGITELSSVGGKDIFLVAYDDKGLLNFANSMGGSGDDIANALAVTSMGDIYITGSFEGTADFDPSGNTMELTSQGSTDIFFAGYITGGSLNYAYAMSGTGTNVGTAIYADYDGNLFIGGYFSGQMHADPVEDLIILDGGSGSFFLAKFYWGLMEWVKSDLDASGTSMITDISFDDMMYDVYVTGSFSNTLDFVVGMPTDNLTSSGQNDIFMARFDQNGNLLWDHKLGGNTNDEGIGIFYDYNTNKVYTTGTFTGNADFDPQGSNGSLTSNGNTDIYLASYDTVGTFIWSNNYGGTGADKVTTIESAEGNIMISGNTSGNLSVDIAGMDYSMQSMGGTYSYILEVTEHGKNKMLLPFQGSNDVQLNCFYNNYGMIYTGGSFQGTVDFDPNAADSSLTAAATDAFIGQYNMLYMNVSNPPTQCPFIPLFLNAGRTETSGLQIIWQENDGTGWKNIVDGSYYMYHGNDSIEIVPQPFMDSLYQYRPISVDDFGVDTLSWSALITLMNAPPVSIIGNDTTILPGETVTIDAGAGHTSYLWNTNENTQTINVDSSGYYVVTISDATGCINKDTLAVNVTFLVTIDTATNRIMAVWGRSLNPGTESLNIYRVTGSVDHLLTSIDFSSANRFFDDGVSPDDQSYTYAFERKDKNTGDSAKISRHVTMFLNVIRDPHNDRTILSWNPYEGLSYDTFYVYRGPSQDNMELIGTVKNKVGEKSFEYIDDYFTEELYYRVEIKAEFSVLVTDVKKANSGPFSRSLSNLEDNRQQMVGIEEEEPIVKQSPNNSLKIFPNPMYEFSTIILPEEGYMNLRIIDISGKLAVKENGITGASYGLYRGNLEKGMYIVVLQGEKMYKAKLLVE